MACAGGAVVEEETECDPALGTCNVDAEEVAAMAMLQVNHQANEQHSHLRRAICFDDDANFRHAAELVGQTVKGCADAAEHCTHREWGEGIMFFCPETCG